MKIRFYRYSILILGMVALLASCKPSTSSPSRAWVVTTLAGTGVAGFANGRGTSAQFHDPRGVAVDSSGNIYVADRENHRIRKITANGVVSTLAGSTWGFENGRGAVAQFNLPSDVAVYQHKPSGKTYVYVADSRNQRIRKITIDSNDNVGDVETLAGSTWGFENGRGAAAKFHDPRDVAVDSANNVYVADSLNHSIRKIAIDSNGNGVVSTLAGSTWGFENGRGAAAQFSIPSGVAVDTSDNVYVADWGNHRIRKITAARRVSSPFGSGTPGSANGRGTAAQFNRPSGVAVDSAGNVYVADRENHRIRKITANGVVSTIAGNGTSGFADGAAAQFNGPRGVAVDSAGNVYVADSGNNRIRKLEYRVP